MSSALQVRVDAVAYDAASAVLGNDVAEPLVEAGWTLVDVLSGSGGMAGNDPAAVSWADGYDRAAAAVLASGSDVITASFRLAALLQQTGFNFGMAESASVPGGTVPSAPDRTRWDSQHCTLPAPPSASGASGGAAPSGWSLVSDAVGYVWPNGHQDRLRAAAVAWRAFASSVTAASYDVTRAFACISGEDAPETPDALAACRSVESQLHALAPAVSGVAEACSSYADHLDEAHHAVGDELVSLLEWTAGIEAGGAVLSVFTFGGSELAAQAAEASRIAAAAARIASVLSRLSALARAAAEAIADVAYRAAAISDELRPLLTARIVVAVAERTAASRVADAAATLRELAGSPTIEASDLGADVARNFSRFVGKLPAAAQQPLITLHADGTIEFAAEVSGQVPGSYAVYTKFVDPRGVTLRYVKTTFTPEGRVAHVKVKYP